MGDGLQRKNDCSARMSAWVWISSSQHKASASACSIPATCLAPGQGCVQVDYWILFLSQPSQWMSFRFTGKLSQGSKRETIEKALALAFACALKLTHCHTRAFNTTRTGHCSQDHVCWKNIRDRRRQKPAYYSWLLSLWRKSYKARHIRNCVEVYHKRRVHT